LLLLAAAALAQVQCSSSSTRGPGTGGTGAGIGGSGSGTGGSASGTGGATGIGGLSGECDGRYEPTGDMCLDAELKWEACCMPEELPACDSSNPTDVCIASCILVATCTEMLAVSDEFMTCVTDCGLDPDTFYCHDGVETISWDYVCDGYADCSDGSDELDMYCL